MKIIYPEKATTSIKIFATLLLLVFFPVLLLGALFYLLWGLLLYVSIWVTWKQRFVLFVYSDSPIWKEYIGTTVIPKLQDQAVLLNWSERKTWRNSLPVLVFKYFGGYKNFNPLALVFRPFHLVKDYRFFEAFQEFKYGKPQKVEKLTEELFKNIEN